MNSLQLPDEVTLARLERGMVLRWSQAVHDGFGRSGMHAVAARIGYVVELIDSALGPGVERGDAPALLRMKAAVMIGERLAKPSRLPGVVAGVRDLQALAALARQMPAWYDRAGMRGLLLALADVAGNVNSGWAGPMTVPTRNIERLPCASRVDAPVQVEEPLAA
jgi:hypothetical protein